MVLDTRVLAEQQAKTVRPFEFLCLDGHKYQLPALKELTTEDLQKFEAAETTTDLLDLVEELAPDAVEPIRKMPMGVASDLMATWAKTGGTAGKSPSPSRQTRKGGKQRKQT